MIKQMASIHLMVRVKASIADTYRALTSNNGISRWFTETRCDRWITGAGTPEGVAPACESE